MERVINTNFHARVAKTENKIPDTNELNTKTDICTKFKEIRILINFVKKIDADSKISTDLVADLDLKRLSKKKTDENEKKINDLNYLLGKNNPLFKTLTLHSPNY